MIENAVFFFLLGVGFGFWFLAQRARDKTQKNIGLAIALERHNHALKKLIDSNEVPQFAKIRAVDFSTMASDPDHAEPLLMAIEIALKTPVKTQSTREKPYYWNNAALFSLHASALLSAVMVASWVANGNPKVGDKIVSEILDNPEKETEIAKQVAREKANIRRTPPIGAVTA